MQELLRCNDEQWEALNRSHIMLDLMLDWEEKKTDYSRGQVLRLQLGDILDQVGMAAHTFNAAVYNFNSKKVRCIPFIIVHLRWAPVCFVV